MLGNGEVGRSVPDRRNRVQAGRKLLMPSFAFILGVAPLTVATGAGAEMRQSLGTAVLFGMFGVTCFGLLFTPAFYTFIRKSGRTERGAGLSDVSTYSTSRDYQIPVPLHDRKPVSPRAERRE